MMTSIREHKLRKTELSKLHHLKRELESEILCQNQQERRSDSRNELKKNRPEGTFVTNSRSTSSSSSSSSSSDSSSSPTSIATSMQVDESNQDSSKRQKVTDGADMELEGPVVESE